VLMQSISEARSGKISFDDQIYCSIMLGGKFPQFPVVVVDEDQDLSPLQHKMLGACAAGRIVAVGDRQQAIYAFRGASGDSVERIKGLREDASWTELPLMTTFRCPRAVVERQQRHVPGYRAAGSAPEGKVLDLEGWNGRTLLGELSTPTSTIAVLCRNNAPLFSLAFKLLREGIGVSMLGRDIGKNLEVLAKKIAKEDGLSAEETAKGIEAWRERESSLADVAGHPERASGAKDRADCLLAVLQGSECRTAGELRKALAKLFSAEGGQVTLGSIHRAKGQEWDVVVHLDQWRIPAAAKRAKARGDECQERQEWNLRYVAETRTKETLVLASMAGYQGSSLLP
jgi:hypothetical protein